MSSIEVICNNAREASYRTATLDGATKNKVLENLAGLLDARRDAVREANWRDLEANRGIAPALYKRLELSDRKIDDLVSGLHSLIGLDDPNGKTLGATLLDDGLELSKVASPIGVIGVIFEARPDAFVQIAALCIKSGNCAILKGGREAEATNACLAGLVHEAGRELLPENAIQRIETREQVAGMLSMETSVDLIIPRGGNDLVKHVMQNTSIPVLGHADGICHVYVHPDADLAMAVSICVDSKCQYPSACNALETLLVHRDVAAAFLPEVKQALEARGVALKGCEQTRAVIDVAAAEPEDWDTEYGDFVLAIRVVDSLEAASLHINRHGSHHTDAIVTADEATAGTFIAGIDSASVFWNASTRFADGFRYGFGAEVGISTNRIHARGPVGLEGLMIYKYILRGGGQIAADYAEGVKRFKHLPLPMRR